LKFELLTYTEIANIDFSNTILCLPVGPFEQHGPHLPIATDILIAKYLTESVCELPKHDLEKTGCFLIEAPAVTFAPAAVSEGIGEVPSLSPKDFTAHLGEVLKQYARTGFKKILIIAHHFDLKFVKSVVGAIGVCEREYRDVVIVEPLSAFHYSGGYIEMVKAAVEAKAGSDRKEDEVFRGYLSMEFKSEIHADVKETSLMLYLMPRSVRQDELPHLKPFIVNPTTEFLKLNFTFKSMKAADGYLGSPSRASIFLGEAIFKGLKAHLVETARKMAFDGLRDPGMPLHIKVILSVL